MSTFRIKRYSLMNIMGVPSSITSAKYDQNGNIKQNFYGKPAIFRMQNTNASLNYKLTGQQ